MAGNVAEWVTVEDGFELRGGSWKDDAKGLDISARGKLPAKGETLDHHGIRVLCEPPIVR